MMFQANRLRLGHLEESHITTKVIGMMVSFEDKIHCDWVILGLFNDTFQVFTNFRKVGSNTYHMFRWLNDDESYYEYKSANYL
jgi:hypothetical protein